MAGSGSPASPGQGSRAGTPHSQQSLLASCPWDSAAVTVPSSWAGMTMTPQFQLCGTAGLRGAAAVPKTTEKVRAASQARLCLGKGPGRGVETNLRQQVLVTHGKGCQHSGTGPSRRERRHSRRTSLCSSAAPAAATVRGEDARGDGGAERGKWLRRRRRKIQRHRDFVDGRNLPPWGCQPGRGDQNLPQRARKGQLPKAAPSRGSQAASIGLKTAQAPFQRGDIWVTSSGPQTGLGVKCLINVNGAGLGKGTSSNAYGNGKPIQALSLSRSSSALGGLDRHCGWLSFTPSPSGQGEPALGSPGAIPPTRQLP